MAINCPLFSIKAAMCNVFHLPAQVSTIRIPGLHQEKQKQVENWHPELQRILFENVSHKNIGSFFFKTKASGWF
jgi:hypothetical protein